MSQSLQEHFSDTASDWLTLTMSCGEVALEAGKELRQKRAICWGEVGIHCPRLRCGFPFYPFLSESWLSA